MVPKTSILAGIPFPTTVMLPNLIPLALHRQTPTWASMNRSPQSNQLINQSLNIGEH